MYGGQSQNCYILNKRCAIKEYSETTSNAIVMTTKTCCNLAALREGAQTKTETKQKLTTRVKNVQSECACMHACVRVCKRQLLTNSACE